LTRLCESVFGEVAAIISSEQAAVGITELSRIRIEPYVVPAASIGPENPLPFFRATDQDLAIDFEANRIPPEDRAGLGWQTGFRVLPYRMQDTLTRIRKQREFTSIVMENEYLRVRVLPEVGGLVTSMIHKPLDRQLLYCNPVFQPGNLALRNAWVSGGIEWNTPHLGHHYLTCEPIHTARVTGSNAEPVLRMYAWDRVKCFPYQIDLHLPDGSKFLFAHVRLVNPHKHEMPMYWWTNMAVPEYPGGRVICRADTAYKDLHVVNCPVIEGLDHSYATRVQSAYDLFFRIHNDKRPWIAVVDREGAGLIHASTRRLSGRKMFAWGMSPGGRRWNEHLATPDNPFQEIQAGLACTQSHSVPMPAETEWSWTEAFGYFESDPERAHSGSWREAYEECDRVLNERLPEAALNQIDADASATAVRVPDEILFTGLGWGALENRRAVSMSMSSRIPKELPFPDSDLGEEQAPWLALLESGALPERDPARDPGHYMIQDEWVELLERSTCDGRGDHWLTWYHLGVARMENGDCEGARQAWGTSLQRTPNAWAFRNLAVLDCRGGDGEKACELLKLAWEANPTVAAIAVEYGNALLRLERYAELEAFIADVPDHVSSHERIQMLSAEVAIHYGWFDLAEAALDREFATIKEGEVTLTDIWFRMWERRLSLEAGVEIDDELRERVRNEFPPPSKIDFRLSVPDGEEYTPPQSQYEK